MSTFRTELVVVAGALAFALAYSACGGDSSDTNAASGGTGASGAGGSGSSGTGLPPPPGPNKAGDGMGKVFAINQLYLGDTNRDGSPNTANGWRQYGFNLDGKASTAASTDLCKPYMGALKEDVYEDGDNGIDNSFGANILPIIKGLASDASTQINDAIDAGSFTIMLEIQKLGEGSDYNPLLTQLFGGSKLATAPKWDGTDLWPVIPELLVDPTDISKGSKITFPKSYVAGGTWVSGDPSQNSQIKLSLEIQGISLSLDINRAIVAMQLEAGHSKATRGTIAGVIETESFIKELGKIAGQLADLCPGSPTFESIANNLRQASDILSDATQDPGKTCDGISIGLGFDMSEVKLGDIGPMAMPGVDPCQGGTGGAGGAAP